MSKKQSLVEAAAEIFNGTLHAKQGQEDKFGLGKTLNHAPQQVVDLGQAHIKNTEPFADFTKGVPTATPPGATPPVGKEQMHKLPTQPQQNQGHGSTEDPEKLPRQNLDSIRDRKTNVTPHVKPGEGNKPMPWARNESIILTDEELEEFLEEAKKAGKMGDGDNDKDDRKNWVKSWKNERKQANRAKAKEEKKTVKEELQPYLVDKTGISEDVDAILSGETLSPEFKEKATMIFEAAVMSKVTEIVDVLETLFTENLDEAIEEISEELESKIDEYLSYMVEEWIKENEIAVEAGLRSEIVEDFMAGLRDLFIEHYIDIPEEKVDVVTELSEKIASLEEQLNSQVAKNIDLTKEISEGRKAEVVNSVCEGLTKTQVDKIRSLAESVDYTTDEEYKAKIATIKESYFPVTTKVRVPGLDALNDDSLIVEDNNTVIDPFMQSLVNSISRTVKH